MFDHKSFLQSAPHDPGVYRMFDTKGKLLYVGKAKNLQHRLSSYFRPQDDLRIAQMVKRIAKIELNITSSEYEALLLENNLIKALKPRYNILFRDDKSYPYLLLSKHAFPRLVSFRGKPSEKGQLFGPFTSAMAVREALGYLQKTFLLRQCDDHFFKSRSRPCLQYQIKRCSAPCVQYIDAGDYAKDVEQVERFLKGKNGKLLESLVEQMQTASEQCQFEEAASIRDQVVALRTVTSQQAVVAAKGNIDVLAALFEHNTMCIHLMCVRGGRILDSHHYFTEQSGEQEPDGAVALEQFIAQLYLSEDHPRDYPSEIIVNHDINQELLGQLLSEHIKKKITLSYPQRGDKTKWLDMATNNARQAIKQRVTSVNVISRRWLALKEALGFNNGLQHIECFDISHSHGEAAMASCVVFDQNGPNKKEYRSFGLSVDTGDDYAAMREALIRRYTRRKSEGKVLPDIIIIDGGKGQLSTAIDALKECQLRDTLLVGIAKGPTRKAGLETLFVTSIEGQTLRECDLMPHDPALHLLQHIRDEAHRFAITKHRKRLAKSRKTSILEGISGVGPGRRQKLLSHFGGLQALKGASVEDIANVPGISKALAQLIYQALHE